MDGFLSLPDITEEESELIRVAKRAITTGKFQQLQRDVNKLKSATQKTPVKPSVLLEKLIKIISSYPLESFDTYNENEPPHEEHLPKPELHPEIIISESFNS